MTVVLWYRRSEAIHLDTGDPTARLSQQSPSARQRRSGEKEETLPHGAAAVFHRAIHLDFTAHRLEKGDLPLPLSSKSTSSTFLCDLSGSVIRTVPAEQDSEARMEEAVLLLARPRGCHSINIFLKMLLIFEY